MHFLAQKQYQHRHPLPMAEFNRFLEQNGIGAIDPNPVFFEMTLEELTDELRRHAVERKLEQPFVFRIDALFPKLELHVVDGSKIEPGTSPAEHHAAAVQVKSTDVPATLVGFYSTQHAGIFTHHGQATHIHAVLADPLVTGHADAGVVPAGAILKLPRP